MKKFHLAILMIFTIMCSCNKDNRYDNIGYNDLPYYDYFLYLSIQDASGNNIAKGIDCYVWDSEAGKMSEVISNDGGVVKPDLYTLEIVFPDPCMDVYHPQSLPGVVSYDEYVPVLAVHPIDDDYFLYLRTSSNINKNCPNPAEMLVFKLKCPYMFGDDAVHEIVTYWKEGNKPTNSRLCYRVALDGKDSTEEFIYEDHNQRSRATLKLRDR